MFSIAVKAADYHLSSLHVSFSGRTLGTEVNLL